MSKRSIRDKLSDIKSKSTTQKDVNSVVDDKENAFFGYSVVDNMTDYPNIEIRVKEYDDNSLSCLADMLIKMTDENFVFYVLAFIEQGFIMEDKYEEFLMLVEKYDALLQMKQNSSNPNRPCIEPVDLI